MKKILAIFLLVMVLAVGTVIAGDADDPWKGSNRFNFPEVAMAGISMSTGTNAGQHPIGAGNILVYDIFVVCTTSATTGSVYLTNTAGTAILTLDVPSANAAGTQNYAGKVRRVCPWGDTGIPVKYTAGLTVYTSGSSVKAYVLFKN